MPNSAKHRWAVLVTALVVAPIVGRQGVARAQVFQPGTQPAGEDGGVEVPIQGSETCLRCHGLYDASRDFEPWDTWRGSMMANAGRDPVFLAALAIAEADIPAAADVCIRCHSPPAWLNGRSSLPEWSMADGPRLAEDTEGFPSNDRDGVTCMVCHRMDGGRPPGTPEPALANAQIYFLDGADADTRLGPYSYLPGTEPFHPTDVSSFLASAELCGTCHDIHNPVVMGRRADGTPTGRPFAMERTYSEWYASAYRLRGEPCQSCHMPLMEMPVLAADGGRELRDYFRRHDLAGGNRWVPQALAAGLTAPRDDLWRAALEATAARAEAQLGLAAVVSIRASDLTGDTATGTVRVTNLAGHKLPTGYPEGRRMWLEVVLLDDTGRVVGGSGLFDETTGDLVDPSDPQLRTYEAKLGIGTMESFHFILNDTLLLDTRIPPEGFDPDPTRDMDIIGRDYSDGAGGFRNWDEVSYTLAGVCGTGDITLRARLRYQSTTREYIEFLRDNAPDSLDPAVDNWGRISYDLWSSHGGRVPSDMAEATADLGPAPAPCPVPDAGVPDAGMLDAGMLDAGAPDAGPISADSGPADGGAPPPPDDDGGCGCAVPGRMPSPGGPLAALLVLGAVLCRRLRRP